MSTTNNIVNLMVIYEKRNKPVHRTGQGLENKKNTKELGDINLVQQPLFNPK